MTERRLSIPEHTIMALMAMPDGDDVFALDPAEAAAWLDARGLDYSWVSDQETDAERIRRLFGTS